jgi:hypothetical protein
VPLKLVPPRKGKSPFWSVRGTYLGVYVDRTTKADKKNVAIQVLKKIEGEIERCEFAQPAELTFAAATLAYMKAGGERTYIRKLLEHFKEMPVIKLETRPGCNRCSGSFSLTAAPHSALNHVACDIVLNYVPDGLKQCVSRI